MSMNLAYFTLIQYKQIEVFLEENYSKNQTTPVLWQTTIEGKFFFRISDLYFVREIADTISCIILPQQNDNSNFCFHLPRSLPWPVKLNWDQI